ncbi:MAG: thiol peroxidase [Pseudomonadota bacterium]
MGSVTFKHNPIETIGDFPHVGDKAADFKLVTSDLSEFSLADVGEKRLIFNIFPSVDTPVCAMQLKKFSQLAAELDNTLLLFASLDLPFAFSRFCAAEGIKNAITSSDYRHRSLANNYGVQMEGGPLEGLYARAVIVLDEEQAVLHSELVQEVTDEPDYEAAIMAIKKQ